MTYIPQCNAVMGAHGRCPNVATRGCVTYSIRRTGKVKILHHRCPAHAKIKHCVRRFRLLFRL